MCSQRYIDVCIHVDECILVDGWGEADECAERLIIAYVDENTNEAGTRQNVESR